MSLYIYALAEEVATVDALAGVAGESLRLLAVEGITVVYGLMSSRPAPDRATLLAQDRIVRTLHDGSAALLPMRFGSAFPAQADVERVIRLQASSLRERLQLVRHREQMTVRVLSGGGSNQEAAHPPAQEPHSVTTPGAGTQYLQARAAPPEMAPLLQAVSSLVRATRVERGKSAGMIATAYQLIDRGGSVAYHAALRDATAAVPTLSVHVSGPAPCYAFG